MSRKHRGKRGSGPVRPRVMSGREEGATEATTESLAVSHPSSACVVRPADEVVEHTGDGDTESGEEVRTEFLVSELPDVSGSVGSAASPSPSPPVEAGPVKGVSGSSKGGPRVIPELRVGERYKGRTKIEVKAAVEVGLCTMLGLPPQLLPGGARRALAEGVDRYFPDFHCSALRSLLERYASKGTFDMSFVRIEQAALMADVLETLARVRLGHESSC